MNLTWIEDLLAIAESTSLSEAAQRRNITQPAFSRRIQGIEDRLGVKILDRTRRPAQPTSALTGLKDQLRRIAKDLRQVSLELSHQPEEQAKQIIIACQHSLAVSFAPQLSRSILAKTDNLSLRVRSGNRDECLWLFTTRQAHIIMAYEIAEQPLIDSLHHIDKAVIWSEQMIPVATPYFLDKRVQELDDDRIPVITYPESVFMGRFNSESFTTSLQTTKNFVRAAETSFTLAAKEMALAHLGIAWLPESLVADDLIHNRLSNLSLKYPAYPISLVALHFKPFSSPEEEEVWNILLSHSQKDFKIRPKS